MIGPILFIISTLLQRFALSLPVSVCESSIDELERERSFSELMLLQLKAAVHDEGEMIQTTFDIGQLATDDALAELAPNAVADAMFFGSVDGRMLPKRFEIGQLVTRRSIPDVPLEADVGVVLGEAGNGGDLVHVQWSGADVLLDMHTSEIQPFYGAWRGGTGAADRQDAPKHVALLGRNAFTSSAAHEGAQPYVAPKGAQPEQSSTNSPSSTSVLPIVDIRPTAEPFSPILSKNTDITSKGDFPANPPITLESQGHPPQDHVNLGGGMSTLTATGLRVSRSLITLTNRDINVASATGTYLYASLGDISYLPFIGTLHQRFHVYEARTGRRLAVVRNRWWTWHEVWEIASYDPVCPTQNSDDTDDGVPLYNYARMTKMRLTLYDHWTIETHRCDGSLQSVWEIKPRYWVNWDFKSHFDFTEPGSVHRVGSFDKAYLLSFLSLDAADYNAWITKGEDQNLFATTSILIDTSLSGSASDFSAMYYQLVFFGLIVGILCLSACFCPGVLARLQ